MKRLFAVFAALLVLLTVPVFATDPPQADGSVFTTVNVAVVMSESGQAEVTQTMTLALSHSVDVLQFGVPEQAKKPKLSAMDSKVTTSGGARVLEVKSKTDFSGVQNVTMTYINRTIQRLENQRAALEEQVRLKSRPSSELRRLKFEPLDFEEKKVVAATFIKEIRLSGDQADVIWNV